MLQGKTPARNSKINQNEKQQSLKNNEISIIKINKICIEHGEIFDPLISHK